MGMLLVVLLQQLNCTQDTVFSLCVSQKYTETSQKLKLELHQFIRRAVYYGTLLCLV